MSTTSVPSVVLFGSAADRKFPLILVVGREPNHDFPMEVAIGPYDFRLAPKCMFWNSSYSMIASTSGSMGDRLKAACIARMASPIVYAGALPEGIPTRVGPKHLRRSKHDCIAIDRHIAGIFSFERIMRRVEVILLSGLNHAVFEPSAAAFRRVSAERGIACIDVPFFTNQNAPKLRAAFVGDTQVRVAHVLAAFLAS